LLKAKFGQRDKYRAYFFAGAGVLMVGIMDSGILQGRPGFIIGLGYMVAWLATGIVFALQSRREWRETTRQKKFGT
jgi:hypothetical protein